MSITKLLNLFYIGVLCVFVLFEVRFQVYAYQETGIAGIYHKDFANYWMAPKLFLAGNLPDLFDISAYMEALRAEFGNNYSDHNWSYPPTFILFCLPLALLSYEAAFVLFFALTLLFFCWATACFLANYESDDSGKKIALTDPLFVFLMLAFVLCNIRFAQNGFLTGGLLLLALANWNKSPIIGGIFLGLLTFKPQLGVLLPLFLLLDRNWKMFFSASVTTIALIVVSLVIFGPQAWIDYFEISVPWQTKILTEFGAGSSYPYMMFSGFMAARMLGIDGAFAWIIHAAFAIPALVLSVWMFIKSNAWLDKSAAILLGTFLFVPYAFNYDVGALSVIFAIYAVRSDSIVAGSQLGEVPVFGRIVRLLFAIAAILPVLGFQLNYTLFPLIPAVLMMCLVTVSPIGKSIFERLSMMFNRRSKGLPVEASN